jgi:hypothetical protein
MVLISYLYPFYHIAKAISTKGFLNVCHLLDSFGFQYNLLHQESTQLQQSPEMH